MLLGREAECTRIDQLLARARGGTGGALLLSGEPGIGKSALCGYAIERAGGMTVLSAQGMESEAELPFAGLLELFRGRLDHLDDLPAPQAAALGGALALYEQTATDRFAIYAGVLSLLGALAEDGPVLVVIDDVQWIDVPSAEAVFFAARRLGAARIGVLIAGRNDVRFEVPAGVPRVILGGLGAAAGRALLAREPRPVAPDVRDQLLEAMRGNPLALTEITGTLEDDQLTGARPLDDPLSAGPTLERGLLRRVAPLPDATRQALLVAAASDTDSVERVLGGLSALGLAAAALAAAERAGAIDIAGLRLRFRHPLLRSAVYHGASSVDRRAAHRALAEASDGERRAWHLAAAAVGPDETVAQALEDAARTAASRGAHAAAARALERSAGVSPDVDQRVRRLTEAARAAQVAGRAPDDGQLLERALGLTEDPMRRAEIQLLRGRQIAWHGEPARAHELLVGEAGRVQGFAPGMAAMMLAEAVLACFTTGEVTKALETAQAARAAAVADGGIQAEMVTALLLAGALQLSGERHAARALLGRYLPALRAPQALQGPGDVVATVAHCFFWLEEYVTAGELYDRVVTAARAASAPAALPYALAGRSELAFRTGRWPAATADAAEAIELSDELRQPAVTGWALSCLAIVEAGRGEATACRHHISRADALVTRTGAASGRAYTGAALGLLELGRGRLDAAVAALEPVARFTNVNGLREPQVVQWAPDLIEALVRSGRHDEAVCALESFDEQARHTGGAWALAAAARCHGLLAAEDFERWFEKALDSPQGLLTPFERARTELCYGERLRRAGRRTRARTPLRSALAAFDALGAAPWSERARAELRATGETVRRRRPSAADHLTPQETQVALLVAGGASNREAAASLFVTAKTIEFHLGRIYRKLGIRSRTQLSVRLSRGDLVPGVAGDD